MVEGLTRQLRRQVIARANERCEYCLTPEWALLAGCEVDHVISRKHGGATDLDNLALSCARCNRYKGTDIGSVAAGGTFTRLFNPRTDKWNEHFAFNDSRMVALTEIGDVTMRLLRLNDEERIVERAALMRVEKLWPSK
jgi:hypothetical protein